MSYIIKVSVLSLFISLCFGSNTSKAQNINLHSHSHIHIQGSSHVHEHTHVESQLTLFYNIEEDAASEVLLNITYLEDIQKNQNPLLNIIFRPPIT